MTIPFRTAYGEKTRSGLIFPDDGRTEQCHKTLCDVHSIIRRHDKTGLLDHVNATQARYGDFTEVNEYQTSLNMVMAAQERFSALPAHIRKKFDNDPGQFIEFVTNPKNQDEMIELGLAVDNRPPKTTEKEEKPSESTD